MTKKHRSLPGEVETFGGAVRYLREQKGLSLRALADAVGVSAPFLSDVERDRRATDKIDALAAALDVDPDEIRRFDPRLDPELKDWLRANPGIVSLLRELRESGQTSHELRELLAQALDAPD